MWLRVRWEETTLYEGDVEVPDEDWTADKHGLGSLHGDPESGVIRALMDAEDLHEDALVEVVDRKAEVIGIHWDGQPEG